MDYPQQCSLAKPVGALGLLRVGVGVGEHDIHAVGKAHRPEGRKIGPDALDHRPGSEPASMRRTPFSIMIDRKSVVLGKSVSVRVDLGGRRIIKKKKDEQQPNKQTNITNNITSQST